MEMKWQKFECDESILTVTYWKSSREYSRKWKIQTIPTSSMLVFLSSNSQINQHTRIEWIIKNCNFTCPHSNKWFNLSSFFRFVCLKIAIFAVDAFISYFFPRLFRAFPLLCLFCSLLFQLKLHFPNAFVVHNQHSPARRIEMNE